MEIAFALVAAVVATGFAVELYVDWRRRPRTHALVWAVAMSAYALATWALVAGLSAGWGEASFKAFYYLGAIANIPLLAAGSVFLAFGERIGHKLLFAVLVWVGVGLAVVVASPLVIPVAAEGIPEGSELFDAPPRIIAALSGAIGASVLIGLASYSIVRFWRSNRRLAFGNVLIVLGALSPALGGTLTGLGESGGLALSLLMGAVLLWSGYRVASGARRTPAPPAAVDVAEEAG